MPSSPGYKRNYKQELRTQKKRDATKGDPKGTKDRVARNKARAAAKRRGAKVSGKDIGHKKALKGGGSRSTKNTKVESRSGNRSKGGKAGSRAGKAAGGRKGGKRS